MIVDKPYSAFFTHEGTVIGLGDNVTQAERAAVIRMKNSFTVQELYMMGCYCKAISEKDYIRLINKQNTDLSLFIKK